MSSVRILELTTLALATVGQAMLLWLQLRAWRRYKHRSFALLALSNALGVTYAAVSFLLYTVPSTVPSPQVTYTAILVIASIQIPLAVWGMAWLFRKYGQLEQRINP